MPRINPITGLEEFTQEDLLMESSSVDSNITSQDNLSQLEDVGYEPPTQEQMSDPGFKAAAAYLKNSNPVPAKTQAQLLEEYRALTRKPAVTDPDNEPVLGNDLLAKQDAMINQEVEDAANFEAILPDNSPSEMPPIDSLLTAEDRASMAAEQQSPVAVQPSMSEAPMSEAKKKQTLLEEYKRLTQNKQDSNRNLDLLMGGNQIAQAIASGYGGKIGDGSEAVNQLRKSANAPVEDYLGRTKALDVENELQLNDPVSDISKLKRTAVKDLAQKANVDLSELGDLESLSAKQLDEPLRILNYTIAQKDRSEALKQQALQRQQNYDLQRAERADKIAFQREEKEKDRQIKAEKEALITDKQADKFSEFDKTRTLMKDIGSMVKENFVGPVDQMVPDYFVGEDQAAFRSALGKLKDEYRKAITGAAASEKEIAMLETRLPSLSDKPENFKAKLEQSLKELNKIQNSYANTLAKKGKNVENYLTSEIQQEPATIKVKHKKSGQIIPMTEEDAKKALSSPAFEEVK